MRLFVAIPVSETVRAVLRGLQEDLKRQGMTGNFTKEENFHITLAFIGEYPDPQAVLDVMNTIPFASSAGYELRLKGYGSFGDIWWVGTEKCPALEDDVRRLRHALAEAEIPFDRKAFRAHLTLVREARSLLSSLPVLKIPDTVQHVDHIALMRSERGKNGMIYTEL